MNLARDHSAALGKAKIRAFVLLGLGAVLLCSISFFVRHTIALKIATLRAQNTALVFQQPDWTQLRQVQEAKKSSETILKAMQNLEELKSAGIGLQKIEFSAGSFFAYTSRRSRQKTTLHCWQQGIQDVAAFKYIC